MCPHLSPSIDSDGAGRSGTYILVDMVLNKMAKGKAQSGAALCGSEPAGVAMATSVQQSQKSSGKISLSRRKAVCGKARPFLRFLLRHLRPGSRTGLSAQSVTRECSLRTSCVNTRSEEKAA